MATLNGDVCFTPNNGHAPGRPGMSAKCQKLPYAPQQLASLFDHLICAGE
jgi:hypothetical protein